MAIEIERRFLVDVSKLPDLSGCTRKEIIQGYYNTGQGSGVVRVRIMNRTKAFLTTKFKTKLNSACMEFEYEIPVEDAGEIMFMLPWKIAKTRFEFPFIIPDTNTILKWEIDFFKQDLPCIAEVEIPDIGIEFDLPDWIIREVTDIGGISNFDCARDPDQVKRLLS